MQGIATVRHGSSLLTIRNDYVSTLTALEADARTATEAQKFRAFGLTWSTVFNRELELSDEQVRAQALIWYSDTMLDGIVDELEATLLKLAGNDRSSALYQRYFGQKTPSQLTRPVLGDELETLRKFVPGLLASEETELKAVGAKLDAIVKRADEAVTKRDLADAAMADFRGVGDRKKLVDEFNALRVEVFGVLARMPHEHPEWQLPSDFARSFFRAQRVSYRGAKTPLNSAEIDAQIAELQTQLIALQELRAEAVAREQRESDEKAKLAADMKALEEAEAGMAGLRDRINSLRNRIKGK